MTRFAPFDGPNRVRGGAGLWFMAALAVVFFGLVILERAGVSSTLTSEMFGLSAVIAVLVIAFRARTMSLSAFFVAEREVPPGRSGLALAADGVTASLLLTFVGSTMAGGPLAFVPIVALLGGYVLATVLFAPHFRTSGAVSIGDFLAVRGGSGARFLAAIAVFLSACCMLVAQLQVIGVVATRSFAIPPDIVVAGAMTLIVVLVVLGGVRAAGRLQIALLWLILAGLALPLMAYWVGYSDVSVPSVDHGAVIGHSLALDFQPSASTDGDGGIGVLSALALIACVTIGASAFPTTLMRFGAVSNVRGVRHAAMVGSLVVGGVSVLLIMNVMAAMALLQSLDGLYPVAAPDWVFAAGRNGLLELCGVAPVSRDVLVAACQADVTFAAALKLEHVVIAPDRFFTTFPILLGLPALFSTLAALGVIAAGLATAIIVALAAAAVLSHDIMSRLMFTGMMPQRRLFVARMSLIIVVAVAARSALTQQVDPLTLMSWSLSIAAGGIFPGLVMMMWWRRMTAEGLIVGMVCGLFVTLAYIAATAFGRDLLYLSGDEMAPWLGVGAHASGLYGAVAGFAGCVAISLIMPKPGPAEVEPVELLRTPRSKPFIEL